MHDPSLTDQEGLNNEVPWLRPRMMVDKERERTDVMAKPVRRKGASGSDFATTSSLAADRKREAVELSRKRLDYQVYGGKYAYPNKDGKFNEPDHSKDDGTLHIHHAQGIRDGYEEYDDYDKSPAAVARPSPGRKPHGVQGRGTKIMLDGQALVGDNGHLFTDKDAIPAFARTKEQTRKQIDYAPGLSQACCQSHELARWQLLAAILFASVSSPHAPAPAPPPAPPDLSQLPYSCGHSQVTNFAGSAGRTGNSFASMSMASTHPSTGPQVHRQEMHRGY